MGKGSGYGKVILFNEHFVVYGIPSIASAIDSKTVAMVERATHGKVPEPSGKEGSMAGDGWVMEDDRPANPGYKAEKFPQQKKSIELVFQAAGFDPMKNPVKIHLGGDLIAVGGVGASAAVCVSVARALNEEFAVIFPAKIPGGMPPSNPTDHRIDLVQDRKIPWQKLYRLSPAEDKELQGQLSSLEK